MKKMLTILALVFCFSSIPVSASTKTDAKNAFRNYMRTNGITSYAFIYFDNDSVPELLVNKQGIPALYKYKNGSVVGYKNSTPGLRFQIIGYYKKMGCLVEEYESNGANYHAFTTTYWTKSGTALYNKLQKREYKSGTTIVKPTGYSFNKAKSTDPFMGTTSLTKKKYLKKLKNITDGKNMTKVKWVTYKAPMMSMLTASISVGNGVQLSVTNSSGTVKWKTSDKKVASVTSKGYVTGKTAGTATITATVSGVTVSCLVTVTGAYLHDNTERAGFIGTKDEYYGGIVRSVNISGDTLIVYGGICHPVTDRDNNKIDKYDYVGENKFVLSSKTNYSYETYDGGGQVSKDAFVSQYLNDFLQEKNYFRWLFIWVKDGTVTDICVGAREPELYGW